MNMLSAMKENRKHARTGAQLKPRNRNSKNRNARNQKFCYRKNDFD